jgi:hypothetical protein
MIVNKSSFQHYSFRKKKGSFQKALVKIYKFSIYFRKKHFSQKYKNIENRFNFIQVQKPHSNNAFNLAYKPDLKATAFFFDNWQASISQCLVIKP